MLVYRIEDATGFGPWWSDAADDYDHKHRCRDRYHSAGDPPGPQSFEERGTDLYRLFGGGRRKEYFFGFRTKAQLRRWFRSAAGRRAMQVAGCRLNTYEVTPDLVAKGNWQVAFVKASARLVATLDLVTLN